MNVNQVPVYVVIPTYNEAQSIPVLLKEILELGIKNINILIVDDNSPDDTQEKVKTPDGGKSQNI